MSHASGGSVPGQPGPDGRQPEHQEQQSWGQPQGQQSWDQAQGDAYGQAPAYGQQPSWSQQQTPYPQGQSSPQNQSYPQGQPYPQGQQFGQMQPYPYQGASPQQQGYGGPVAFREPWKRPHADWGSAIKWWWSNLFVFRGRASRSEYWWIILTWALAYFAISMVTQMITSATLGTSTSSSGTVSDAEAMQQLTRLMFNPGTIIGYLIQLALGIGLLGVSVRRLHDVNRSAWWYFGFIIGSVIANILTMILIFSMFAELVKAVGTTGTPNIGGQMLGIILISLLVLGFSILLIVWLASDSKPEGARFDLMGSGRLPSPPVQGPLPAEAQVGQYGQGFQQGQQPQQWQNSSQWGGSDQWQNPGHEQNNWQNSGQGQNQWQNPGQGHGQWQDNSSWPQQGHGQQPNSGQDRPNNSGQ